jgi:Bacterial Ig-like domain
MPQVTSYGIPTPAAGAFTVLNTTPANAATNVPVNQVIRLEFSTAMLGTTINNTNITMSPSPARQTTVFRDDCTVFVTPDSNLSANTTYQVTVTTNVKSLFGWNPLSAQYQFSFTTAP